MTGKVFMNAIKNTSKENGCNIMSIFFACGSKKAYLALNHNGEVGEGLPHIVANGNIKHIAFGLNMLKYGTTIVDNIIYVRKMHNLNICEPLATVTVIDGKYTMNCFQATYKVHMIANMYESNYAYTGIKRAKLNLNYELVYSDVQPSIYYSSRRIQAFLDEYINAHEMLPSTEIYNMF